MRQTLNPKKFGKRAQKLLDELLQRIVGQDAAVMQAVNAYQLWEAGMSREGRPVSNILLLGPTGTGKTYLPECIAGSLVGNMRAVTRIDCAEFAHSHEIAKLIGSPPGYLGHRETHPMLSQDTLNQYHTENCKLSLVLFDEIEKASDSLWNLLLGILDKASLTLGDNSRVDFSKAMIFMTGNVGARQIEELAGNRLGFGLPMDGNADLSKQTDKAAKEAARRRFSPEFINRLDHIAVFQALTRDQMASILLLELNKFQLELMNTPKAFAFQITPAVEDFLLREGTDRRYGARYLKRTIEHWLITPISHLVASKQIEWGDVVRVEADDSELRFVKTATGLSPTDLQSVMCKGVTVNGSRKRKVIPMAA